MCMMKIWKKGRSKCGLGVTDESDLDGQEEREERQKTDV